MKVQHGNVMSKVHDNELQNFLVELELVPTII